MTIKATIDHLGAQGDGIANTPQGQIFVPFTLPGETVNAQPAGKKHEALAILEASPGRVEPVCRHFTACGGCQFQHWQAEPYRAWKRALVTDALKARGIEAPVGDLVTCGPGERRRVQLSAKHGEGGAVLGFHGPYSYSLFQVEECPVTDPRIVAALPQLRRLAAVIAGLSKPFHMIVTATDTGLDIAIRKSGKLPEAERKRAAALVLENRWARLSVDGEIVLEPVKPQIRFGNAVVVPPPGGFLQAVPAIEAAMAAEVIAHLGKVKQAADLFAGAGAFALRMAERMQVHAVEGDGPALAALDAGFRSTAGLKRVSVERRDLFQRPLLPRELLGFDALVFDPPRAGAEAQARHLAKSDIRKVAAVSCNPVTLARDLEILMDGGYRLVSVTPYDQFLFTAHVEAVALLEKPVRRR